MLAPGFNIIIEDNKFYGVMDAVDYSGNALILFKDTLTKEILSDFIYKVKMEGGTQSKSERYTQVNAAENRLRVCKKLLAANVPHTKKIMQEFIQHAKNKAELLSDQECEQSKEGPRVLLEEMKNDWIKIYQDWERTLKAYSYKSEKTTLINEMDIIRAKEFPVNELVKFNSQKFARCIWHSDNTPSMKYYPKTNSVHCFSCSKSGDSIAMAQQLFGENFINAVKRLANK